MLSRRTALLATVAAFSRPALAQGGRISRLGEAIDMAGAQRMLSQRMGKAWLGQLRPELADRARAVLKASEARFERQLGELLAYAPTPEIAGSYKAMLHRFDDYRALLRCAPCRDRVDELLQTSGEMLSLAQMATGQLQSRTREDSARLVNLSGRQRMLSQRLALYFLAGQQGARTEQVRDEMALARAEFDVALETLCAAARPVPAIRANLDLARNQWVFLQAALAGESRGPQAADEVFVASENLLTVMETVTGQFARQLG